MWPPADIAGVAAFVWLRKIIRMHLIVFCHIFPNFLTKVEYFPVPFRNTKRALIIPCIHKFLALVLMKVRF
jgi:hypothetical protein